jgi:hypothetical protein
LTTAFTIGDNADATGKGTREKVLGDLFRSDPTDLRKDPPLTA